MYYNTYGWTYESISLITSHERRYLQYMYEFLLISIVLNGFTET